MRRRIYWWLLLLLLASGMTACTSEAHPAAASVETFLQALAEKDEAQYVVLTCADFEQEALLEYDAFSLVKTRLEGLDCQTTSVESDAATVSCQGEIVATYGNEDQVFELHERSYTVLNQGGAWLVCGY